MNDFHSYLKTLSGCYQCGRCSSCCDSNRFDNDFQPHRFLHLVSLGMIDEVLASGDLWKCTTCFACAEGCPQGIRVTDILWELKALAFQSGKAPDFVLRQRETIMSAGRIYPIGDRENRKRQEEGLPPLPEVSGEVSQLCAALEEERR